MKTRHIYKGEENEKPMTDNIFVMVIIGVLLSLFETLAILFALELTIRATAGL